jgi:NAD(P)-dependent dehydrogenase (short-subunit alcohol dehydrogenase family)
VDIGRNRSITGKKMDLELQGKHVLITGGAGGIGFACAQEFLKEGCTLSLVGRDQVELNRALSQLGHVGRTVSVYLADLSDPDDALRVIDAAENISGPAEVLVNAAGAARQKPFAELEPKDFSDAMAAKFGTYMNVTTPLIKRMGSRGSGAIVSVVGMGGKLPITTHLPGGAANAALMLASAGLAMAYGPKGVRVNAVNPSKTATPRLAQNLEAQARQANISVADAMQKAQDAMPLGRLATPQDVANVVVFLASPRAGYISGAILSVDGASRPMIV